MYIKVKVHAGQKKNLLKQTRQDTSGPSFEIWVKSPAERGLANDAIRDMLAAELKIEPKKLRLIKGATSPAKIFMLAE